MRRASIDWRVLESASKEGRRIGSLGIVRAMRQTRRGNRVASRNELRRITRARYGTSHGGRSGNRVKEEGEKARSPASSCSGGGGWASGVLYSPNQDTRHQQKLMLASDRGPQMDFKGKMHNSLSNHDSR